jgi:hypothetical protein
MLGDRREIDVFFQEETEVEILLEMKWEKM